MPTIFISCTHADRPIADYVAGELQRRGGRIADAPESGDHFVLILSPRAGESPRVWMQIADVLRHRKKVTALSITEDAPLIDFPLLLEIPLYQLTRPEHAEAALNGLAAAFGLLEMTPSPPPDATAFTSIEGGDETVAQLTREQQDDLFFTAAELTNTDRGATAFLYRILAALAPEYAQGQTKRLAQQSDTAAREQIVEKLQTSFTQALNEHHWAAATELRERITALIPDNPAAQALKEARLSQLWAQTQAAATQDGWQSAAVHQLALAMREIDPDDERTRRVFEQIEQQATCNAVYAQAEQAVQTGRVAAVSGLMQYIQQHCPDYGDPRGLLRGAAIRPEYVASLKNLTTFGEHAGSVLALAFAPDGTLLVSGGADGTLRLWDMDGLQQVAVQRQQGGGVRSANFSADGMFLVTTTGTPVVRVWSMPEGREAVVLDDFRSDIVDAIFTPDGSALICGYANGGLEIVRIEDGAVLYEGAAHQYAINRLILTQDASRLFTASDDRLVKLWGVADLFELSGTITTFSGHTMIINDMALSPDERLLASVSNDGQLKLWDAATGALRLSLSHEFNTQVRAVAFSPHAAVVASAGVDSLIRIWDMDGGKLLTTLTGHGGAVNTLAFSPDGGTLVSGSSDRTIKLWQLG